MSEPNFVAVDIVILPPPKISALAIRFSQGIAQAQVHPQTVLNDQDCLPHLTVAMGIIDREKIPAVKKELDQMAENLPLVLEFRAPLKVNDTIWLPVGLTQSLRQMHRLVRTKIPWANIKADEDMFVGQLIDARTLDWVDHFSHYSAGDHYWPHITLGFGDMPETMNQQHNPYLFVVNRIALVQIGNFCTAARIIHEVIKETDLVE